MHMVERRAEKQLETGVGAGAPTAWACAHFAAHDHEVHRPRKSCSK